MVDRYGNEGAAFGRFQSVVTGRNRPEGDGQASAVPSKDPTLGCWIRLFLVLALEVAPE